MFFSQTPGVEGGEYSARKVGGRRDEANITRSERGWGLLPEMRCPYSSSLNSWSSSRPPRLQQLQHDEQLECALTRLKKEKEQKEKDEKDKKYQGMHRPLHLGAVDAVQEDVPLVEVPGARGG
jgi:hypothetical protein